MVSSRCHCDSQRCAMMGRGVVSINGGVCAAMRMAAHTLAACRAPPKEPKPVVAGAESASARTVEVYFMVRCRWVGGEADKKESGLHLSDSDGRRKHVTSHTFLKLLFFRLSYESTHSRARRRALVRLARMAGLRSDPLSVAPPLVQRGVLPCYPDPSRDVPTARACPGDQRLAGGRTLPGGR